MQEQLWSLGRALWHNGRDMLPVLAIVAVFQALVISEPVPNLGGKLFGVLAILLGMTLFVQGLLTSVFPLGEGLADRVTRRGSLWLLLLFGFAVGFGSTVAEPALASVTSQAAVAVAEAPTTELRYDQVETYALILRFAASIAVGLAVALGMLRILRGWRASWFVLGGYALAALLILGEPSHVTGIAFDAGAAATSAINIPLIAAIGVGLASVVHGRTVLVDGFGMVAFASVMPMVTILLGAWIL